MHIFYSRFIQKLFINSLFINMFNCNAFFNFNITCLGANMFICLQTTTHEWGEQLLKFNAIKLLNFKFETNIQ